MGKLNFKDIQDWTPSSISVVDQPDHPLALFEVYEDDEEFVKKSIDITEVNLMSNQESIENNESQMVSGPVSFFEKLLNRNVVTKSEEPTKPPEKQPEKAEEKTVSNEEIMKKLEEFDKRISKLEKEDDDSDDNSSQENNEPVNDGEVVTKSNTPSGEEPVDSEHVVTKSRQVDPDDVLTVTKSEKTRMERMGRKNNGMTW